MTRGTTLTPKQAAFCAFIARGETQTEAYIKAYDVQGGSRRSASNEATKLCRMDKIKTRIQELKDDSAVAKREQKKLSKAWIIQSLQDEASNEDNAPSVRVRALEILAKTEKLFDDSTNVTVVHRSAEEVERELQARLQDLNIKLN